MRVGGQEGSAPQPGRARPESLFPPTAGGPPVPPPAILHLITRWLRGGAEAKTLAELEGLRGRYRYTLAHGGEHEPAAAARVDALGVRRVVLPGLRHLAPHTLPGAVREVRALLARERPDLLHVHSTEAAFVGRAAARGLRAPVVYTLHGLPFGPGRAAPLRALVRWVERRQAPRTARFLANSPAIRDAYLAAGIGRPGQYVVVPSGVDLDAAAKAPAATGLPGAPPRILFAGRLAPGKGLRETVAAVEALRAGGLAASLLVAGEGPERARLEAAPRPWLHLLGHRDDLASVMKGCDVVALPSALEGTPRVVTEAMACGIPVVASRVGGIPDQLGEDEAGLLVPPGDARALAEALRLLCSDAALRGRLARAGPRRAAAFGVGAMLERTEEVYRALLGS